jgi:hypothetical protein
MGPEHEAAEIISDEIRLQTIAQLIQAQMSVGVDLEHAEKHAKDVYDAARRTLGH